MFSLLIRLAFFLQFASISVNLFNFGPSTVLHTKICFTVIADIHIQVNEKFILLPFPFVSIFGWFVLESMLVLHVNI